MNTPVPARRPRYRAIDACRGLALVNMIFNHGFRLTADPRLLTPFDRWLWLLGKCGPSLFFLCFGSMLGVIYLDPTRPMDPGRTFRRLWRRGLQVFLSYKLLLLLELAALGQSGRAMRLSLTYGWLGQWVEILDFYAIVLLAAPLILWLWRRVPLGVKLLAFLATAWVSSHWQSFLFPNRLAILQAILVGRQGYYVFPLLPWSLPVMLGLLFGEHFRILAAGGRWRVVGVCLAAAGVLGLAFWLLTPGYASLDDILFRFKHPPRLAYLAWTTGYALLILALCFALMGVERKLAPPEAILETMGQQSLLHFNLHFTTLFVVFGLGLHCLQKLAPVPARACAVGLVIYCMLIGYAIRRWWPVSPEPGG